MIETEFSLAFTFCDLAETEARIGGAAQALRLIGKIREAAESAQRLISQAQDMPPEQADEMRDGLAQLEERAREVARKAAFNGGARRCR